MIERNLPNNEYRALTDTHTNIPGPNNLFATLLDVNTLPVDVNFYGFLNQTETVVFFNETNAPVINNGESVPAYSFQIGPFVGGAAGYWHYYRTGLRYKIIGNKTVSLGAPPVDGTKYWVYIDAIDGTLSIGTGDNVWSLDDTKVTVQVIAWDSTMTPKYLLSEERHTVKITRRDHMLEHYTEGTKYSSGGVLTGPVVNSSTNADKTAGITPVYIFDEDIYLASSAIPRGNGVNPATYVFYRTTASRWAWYKSPMPFRYTGTGAIQFDDNGTMTAATSGSGGNERFVNYYMFVSNIGGEPSICFIPGRSQFTSSSLAYSEAFSSFNLTGLPTNEGIAIWQFTWSTNGSNLGLCKLTRTPVRISSNIISTSVVSSQIHNGLSGLQGGMLNEYYHLTAAEYNGITNGTINTVPRWITATSLGLGTITDDGQRVGIGCPPDLFHQVLIQSNDNTLLVQTLCTTENAYGITSSALGVNNTWWNIGIWGSAFNSNQQNIGIAGSAGSLIAIPSITTGYYGGTFCASVDTRFGCAIYGEAIVNNTQNNVGLWIKTVNAGAGESYIGILDDGRTPGIGKFLKSIDTQGTCEWGTINDYTDLALVDVSTLDYLLIYDTNTGTHKKLDLLTLKAWLFP